MTSKRFKIAAKAKATRLSRVVDIATAAAAATSSSKRSISADWDGSTMTVEQLKGFQFSGLLPSSVKWRAPGNEIEPSPAKGEVVVFGEHLFRGFSPSGILFFRQVLDFYKLRIHDLAPNSILTLSYFVTLCEDYLQIKPDLDLWPELFYCNPHPETSGGPMSSSPASAMTSAASGSVWRR